MLSETELAQWVERLRAALLADPQRHLPWQERQAFYEELGDDEMAQRFRGWLAILSAQRVLPIALKETPWDTDALQIIAAATRFLGGYSYPDIESVVISPESVQEWAHFSNEYNSVYKRDRKRKTIIAHSAALKALYTVNLSEGLSFPKQQMQTVNDEDFAILVATGDSAGAAAVAFALSDNDNTCSPVLLQEYWDWWLSEAMAQAMILSKAKQLYA